MVKYRRILLKLSGEMLAGNKGFGIDAGVLSTFAAEVKTVHELGVEVGIVIGGGNMFRGGQASTQGLDRTTGDYIGMLATTMNALALQDILEGAGMETRVMSAIEMRQIAEPYIRRRATRHMEKGRVVIFAAGTGNPYFTTDTAACLRAMEVEAQVLLKGTKVSGVFDKDPVKFPDAKEFRTLTCMQAIEKQLKVMDTAALSLCMENKMPIIVFDMGINGNLKRVVTGEPVGTLVTPD